MTIEGFQVEAGPGREACGGTARPDGLVGVREFHSARPLRALVPRAEDLGAGLACLLTDTFLREYIPKAAPDGRWPGDVKNGTATGSLRMAKAAALSKHLRRYRAAARALQRDHVLVEATMTDHNGVTNSVLLALRPGEQKDLLVDAAYIDELFEE